MIMWGLIYLYYMYIISMLVTFYIRVSFVSKSQGLQSCTKITHSNPSTSVPPPRLISRANSHHLYYIKRPTYILWWDEKRKISIIDSNNSKKVSSKMPKFDQKVTLKYKYDKNYSGKT